jgi:hypothetical protein
MMRGIATATAITAHSTNSPPLQPSSPHKSHSHHPPLRHHYPSTTTTSNYRKNPQPPSSSQNTIFPSSSRALHGQDATPTSTSSRNSSNSNKKSVGRICLWRLTMAVKRWRVVPGGPEDLAPPLATFSNGKSVRSISP